MCIRQADCILIVGLAGKDPKVQEVGVLYYLCVIIPRWTKMCIRQADCILIVGLAGKDPKVQEVGVLYYLCVIIP